MAWENLYQTMGYNDDTKAAPLFYFIKAYVLNYNVKDFLKLYKLLQITLYNIEAHLIT